jgi:hypothetical protein
MDGCRRGWVGGEVGIGRGGVRVVIFVEKGKGVVESGGVGLVLCSSGCVGSGWRKRGGRWAGEEKVRWDEMGKVGAVLGGGGGCR